MDIEHYSTQPTKCIAIVILTLIRPVDISILIKWTSSFPILGLSDVLRGEDPEQTPRSSDVGLHCLSRSPKRDARLIWVKCTYYVYTF